MRQKRKKRNGVGARCRVLKRFLHPRKDIADRYPNANAQARLDNLVVIRREANIVNRAEKRCIIFRQDDFPNAELHCVERYATVIEEGVEADYFEETVEAQESLEGHQDASVADKETPLLGDTDRQDNIARLRSEGYGVDDNNEPAPENLPDPQEQKVPISDSSIFGDWDSVPNIYHRKAAGLFEDEPKLKKEIDPNSSTSS